VVLGIRPTRPETGYGYLEVRLGDQGRCAPGAPVTEKPDAGGSPVPRSRTLLLEQRHVYLERARPLTKCIGDHLPKTAPLLEEIAQTFWNAGSFQRHSAVSIPSAKTSASTTGIEPRSAKREQNSTSLPAGRFRLERFGRGPHCRSNHTAKTQPADGNLILRRMFLFFSR